VYVGAVSHALPVRVTVSPNVLFQQLEDESVLLNLNNDRYYGLDDVGTRMWALLSEHGDVATALGHLSVEYGAEVDDAVLRHDLGELIRNLVTAGLISADTAPR
jgi:hypothetical protein